MLGYGIGDFGFNFYWFSLQLFLAYYYTDVLGLRSEVAGLVIFLCLTWDGLVDPAIGVLANRTRTRWGKYRPFLLFGSVPLAVSFTLMFAPTGLEGAALIGYAFATQVLFRTMYGLVNIPYSALMATMTRDSMQRNWLAGARMICAFLGTAVVSYFTPRLVTYFTSDGRTAGYFGATAVLAVIATVFTLADIRRDARGLLDHARARAAAAGQRAAAHAREERAVSADHRRHRLLQLRNILVSRAWCTT